MYISPRVWYSSVYIQSYIVAFTVVHITTSTCNHCCSTAAACMWSVNTPDEFWLISCLFDVVVAEVYIQFFLPLGEVFLHI